jgi:hypothetical protein
MKWILGYLDINDQIIFITDVSQGNQYLPYNKFISFIFTHIKDNYKEFLDTVNRFQTFLVNIENKTWEIYKQEQKEPTFVELFKLNEKRMLEKQRKNLKNKDSLYAYKNLILNTSDKKHGRQTGSQPITRSDLQSRNNRNKKF